MSRGESRKLLGHNAYHWAIVVMPENSQGRECFEFDATDAAEIDPVTFRMNNPTKDWWFRRKNNTNPSLSNKLLGRIVLGQLPSNTSIDNIEKIFSRVPLPVKHSNPEQSCVIWAVEAIRALQTQGWVDNVDINKLKDWALPYADDRKNGSKAKQSAIVRYNSR